MNDVESDESWREFENSKEFDDIKKVEEKAMNSQVTEKVKRNRGLKRDILKLLEDNPDALPVEIMASLQSNVYGGSNPVSLNTVMSTMSQIKGKKARQEVHSPDLKEDNKMGSGGLPIPRKVSSDSQDVSSEPKEQ